MRGKAAGLTPRSSCPALPHQWASFSHDEDLGCPFQQHGGVFTFGVCHSAGPPLLMWPVRALLWAQVLHCGCGLGE